MIKFKHAHGKVMELLQPFFSVNCEVGKKRFKRRCLSFFSMHTVQKLKDDQTKFKMYLMLKDIKALLSRVFRRYAVLGTTTL